MNKRRRKHWDAYSRLSSELDELASLESPSPRTTISGRMVVLRLGRGRIGLERELEKLEIMSTEEVSDSELSSSSDISESEPEMESVYPNDRAGWVLLVISTSTPVFVRVELPVLFGWVLLRPSKMPSPRF